MALCVELLRVVAETVRMDQISKSRLVPIAEAALSLGVSPRWVEGRIATGEMPSVKLGKHRRIHEDTFIEFQRYGLVPGRRFRRRAEDAE